MALKQILSHLPKGFKAPVLLARFVKAKPMFDIEWCSMKSLGLKASAASALLPFMRLEDGDVVALWYHTDEPAVVQIGSEGETELLATTFGEFVAAINAGKSGLRDLDGLEENFTVPGVPPAKPRKNVRLQKQFDQWIDDQSAHDRPNTTDADGQALLERLCGIAKRMSDDGCVKPPPMPEFWQINFVVKQNGSRISVNFVKFGPNYNDPIRWPPVPKQYNILPEIKALLAKCKKPNLPLYAVEVQEGFLAVQSEERNKEGHLTRSDHQLTLMTPEKAAEVDEYVKEERARRRK